MVLADVEHYKNNRDINILILALLLFYITYCKCVVIEIVKRGADDGEAKNLYSYMDGEKSAQQIRLYEKLNGNCP